MKRTRNLLPLIAAATCVAAVSAANSFGQAKDSRGRIQRPVATGRLLGTREIHRIVIWQTDGTGHLGIELVGARPRILWQTDHGNPGSSVDSVGISDLDADGIPEIISLWRNARQPGALLRVFHWDKSQQSFVEVQSSIQIDTVLSYHVGRGPRSGKRLVIEARSGSDSRPEVRAYELRNSKLVGVGGEPVVATKGESGIEGQALISPARPGPVRLGESGSAPYKTTLLVRSAVDDREVAAVETDSEGRFRVVLPPGSYRVGAPQRAGRLFPRATQETVTVASGKFVQVTIYFDSGMR